MIRQITKQHIPECVEVIRSSFLTVGKEFNKSEMDIYNERAKNKIK